MEKYDSKADTLEHINRVAGLMMAAAQELLSRAAVHDASKLTDAEKPYFDKYTPMLAKTDYGSIEYKEMLSAIRPALEHHYDNNPHHPEYHEEGIDGMNLFDIMEMFMDWKAASERHENGDIRRSISINEGRFGMSPQLARILQNTADYLNWEK